MEKGPTPLSPHRPPRPRPSQRALTSASGSKPPTSQLRTYQGQGHNAAERKHRNSLNSKLNTLRLCVPCLCTAYTAGVPSKKSPPAVDDYDDNNGVNFSDGDGDGGGGAKQRCRKATIIVKVTAYTLTLEQDSKRFQADMVLCQSRIAAFEALEQADVLWKSSLAAWPRSAVGRREGEY
jgi:hypothetical protein